MHGGQTAVPCGRTCLLPWGRPAMVKLENTKKNQHFKPQIHEYCHISANIGLIGKIPTEEPISMIFLTLTLSYFFEMVNIQGVIHPLSTMEIGA
jgi:hypothetical protein